MAQVIIGWGWALTLYVTLPLVVAYLAYRWWQGPCR